MQGDDSNTQGTQTKKPTFTVTSQGFNVDPSVPASYGQWMNTQVYLRNSDPVTIDVSGQVTLAYPVGLNAGTGNNISASQYQNMSDADKQNYDKGKAGAIASGSGNASQLTDTDYQNNGLGILTSVTPGPAGIQKIAVKMGNVPYVSVPTGCSAPSVVPTAVGANTCLIGSTTLSNAWTWRFNWQYQPCTYDCDQYCGTAFETHKTNCHAIKYDLVNNYYSGSPADLSNYVGGWNQEANSKAAPSTTNVCNSPGPEGFGNSHDDKNWHKGGTTDTCWNINGHQLYALLPGESPEHVITSGNWTNMGTVNGVSTYKRNTPALNSGKMILYIQDPNYPTTDGYNSKSTLNPYPDKPGAAGDNGPGPYWGGYSSYIRADPLYVQASDNPNYLQIAICPSDDPNGSNGTSNCELIDGSAGAIPSIINPSDKGTVWMRIKDPSGDYTTDYGEYKVTLTYTEQVGQASEIFQTIVKLVQDAVNVAVKNTFDNIVSNHDFISYINQLLVLYIIVYAIMFMFGLVQISQLDIVMRLFKISTVIALLQPNSFEYFSLYLFNMLSSGAVELLNALSGNLYVPSHTSGTNTINFPMFDYISPIQFLKLLSLLNCGLTGWVFFYCICRAVFTYTICVIHAVKCYLVSIIFTGILMAAAPVFISFMLFKMTSHIAEKWIRLLIRYAIEPIMMFLGIIVINELVMGLLNGIFAFSICFKCAFLMFIAGIPVCAPNFLPWGYDNFVLVPMTGLVSIASILSLMIYTDIMKQYTTKISGTIMGLLTDTATSPSPFAKTPFSDGAGLFKSAQNMIAKATGTDKKSQERRKGVKDAEANQALSEARGRLNNPGTSGGGSSGGSASAAVSAAAATSATGTGGKSGFSMPAPRKPTSMHSKQQAAPAKFTADRNELRVDSFNKLSPERKKEYYAHFKQNPQSFHMLSPVAKRNIVDGSNNEFQAPPRQTLQNHNHLKSSPTPVAGSGAVSSAKSGSISPTQARLEASNNFSGLDSAKQKELIDYYRNNMGQFALLSGKAKQQIAAVSGGTIQAPTGTSMSERVKGANPTNRPTSAPQVAQGTVLQPGQVGKGPVVQGNVVPNKDLGSISRRDLSSPNPNIKPDGGDQGNV